MCVCLISRVCAYVCLLDVNAGFSLFMSMCMFAAVLTVALYVTLLLKMTRVETVVTHTHTHHNFTLALHLCKTDYSFVSVILILVNLIRTVQYFM